MSSRSCEAFLIKESSPTARAKGYFGASFEDEAHRLWKHRRRLQIRKCARDNEGSIYNTPGVCVLIHPPTPNPPRVERIKYTANNIQFVDNTDIYHRGPNTFNWCSGEIIIEIEGKLKTLESTQGITNIDYTDLSRQCTMSQGQEKR